MARTWSAVLARLGVPTGDGRILDPVGGSSRDLPLPISWQQVTDEGHRGAVTVARMETLRIQDGMVTATGTMLESAPRKAIEELEAGIIGPSVDLDDLEYTMDDQERLVITRWRVAGATLVQIPAFSDVSFTLDPEPVLSAEDAEAQRRADARGEVARPMTAEEGGMIGESMFASAATSVTSLPPLDWFRRPDLDRLTPLTVSDSGRVFGHIAGWETCHVGLPGCVTPPSSATDYTYFHVSEQATVEGPVLPVGTLVAGPRHADAQLAFQAAQQHYDDPAAAVAKVVAGEDEFGIWVAGWLLPTASSTAVEIFRSSPVSGDWRRIGGSLEMIAVCSVNTPGFPVPRARVAFSNGAQRALIGTFGVTPVSGEHTADTLDVIKDSVRARWAWAMAKGQEHAVR